MNLIAVEDIADEICPILFPEKTLHMFRNSWGGDNYRKLVYENELHQLFQYAACVGYLRSGITPKWMSETFVAKCLPLVERTNEILRPTSPD